MDLTPAELDELLVEWALDLLDTDRAAELEAELADDPELAGRADRLRRVVAGLGQSVATTPPTDLRSAVLRHVVDSPRAPLGGTRPLDLFANQVRSLAEVTATLTPDDWLRPAAPYDWTIHELVAHLLVIERYTAARLGLAADTDGGGDTDHLTMGAEAIRAERARAPEDTAAAWHGRAASTIRSLGDGAGPAPGSEIEFHGWPFDVGSLLVARAFEVWTHADDIRRAIARPLEAPRPADLRTMSKLSVRTLPLVWPVVVSETTFGGARVVLTGLGGGTFDLGRPERRDALLVADVEDYCRYAARRIQPGELRVTIEGDEATATGLLAAARAFAV